MFSHIVQRFETPLNALYRERDARRARGLPVLDLVAGNANRAGLRYPAKLLARALLAGAKTSRIYQPDPLGQKAARQAVEAFYRQDSLPIPADQILLTPGTSLSYAYLFRLLADADDEILCPSPSYPLLDSIAEWAGVRLTHYRLREAARWEIDFNHLREQITGRTRALVLISPHNPTGAVAREKEIAELSQIARERELPVIADEVFSAFLYRDKRLPRPTGHTLPLVFTLNGVSKLLALPALKIGWIAVTGEAKWVRPAMRALDAISDTFLPVSEPAQFALPAILRQGKAFLTAYRREVAKRRDAAIRLFRHLRGIDWIEPEGGFYVSLRLRDGLDEEAAALQLLRRGCLTHPGFFYDMEGSHLILSFLSGAPNFCRAWRQIYREKPRPAG